jgi:hypothetical protein
LRRIPARSLDRASLSGLDIGGENNGLEVRFAGGGGEALVRVGREVTGGSLAFLGRGEASKLCVAGGDKRSFGPLVDGSYSQ